MKWSELFASILGDKDVDVSQPTGSQELVQQHSAETSAQQPTTPPVQQNTDTTSPLNNSTQNVPEQNLTQEKFDALNKRIAELESANRELVLKGGVSKQEVATPESLIYSLCVERNNNNGKQTSSNTV